MTHALVMNYGLYKKMEIFRAKPATRKEMAQFHTDDYVDFLSRVTPDNMDEFLKEQAKFNLGDDCPVFDGLFEYCSISAGGSMEGAARLSRDKCDIAINWAGGLHHAKKAEANGFCYINDIVLGILELLRYHKRVLYVDIDVHHGDGVEEAFYTTDRVMTCSFHKYGEFFPGTGELRDTGHGKGKYYAVNFPLRDGITDEAYKNIFEPVIMKIMETYQPSAIVLQCGGDSLSGDRLGSFNVSLQGHANCVRFIKSLGLPLLLLGGGGYTIRNVSRTWAYETGLAAGQELCPDIPMNEYYEYYGPTYRLDVPPSNMEDMNVSQYLEKTKIQIFENLRNTIPVPSVGLQAIPRMPHDEMDVDEDLDDPDERKPQRLLDGLIQRDDEFSDSEDEGEGGRRNAQSHKRTRRHSPKINGNGILNIHNLNKSRHSSFSSSATTSVTDVTISQQNSTSSKNLISGVQRPKPLTSTNRVSRETNASTLASSASPIPPTSSALASEPTLVDIPMLSQADQIELEKLASEALARSAIESGSMENCQERMQMEIDDPAPPKPAPMLQPEPSEPPTSSSLQILQTDARGAGSFPSQPTNPTPPEQSSEQNHVQSFPENNESALAPKITSSQGAEYLSPEVKTSGIETSEGPRTTPDIAPTRPLVLPSHSIPMELDQIAPSEVAQSAPLKTEASDAPGHPAVQLNHPARSTYGSTSSKIKLIAEQPQPEPSLKKPDLSPPRPANSELQMSGRSPPLLDSMQAQRDADLSKLPPDFTDAQPKPSPTALASEKTQALIGIRVDQSCASLPMSHQPMADPMALEVMTDEFVSEVAKAIAEGEAGTASRMRLGGPPADATLVRHDSKVSNTAIEDVDPQLNQAFGSLHKTVSIPSSSASSPLTITNPVHTIQELADVKAPEGPVDRESSTRNQASSQTHTEIQAPLATNSSAHPTRHLHPSLDPSITGPSALVIQSPSNAHQKADRDVKDNDINNSTN